MFRAAVAFENPDYVDVVIHSYRHRVGLASGEPPYGDTEERLSVLPAITVPSVTLDGMTDGNFPATDGAASGRFFTGFRSHHQVPNAGHNLPGHNLPQEAPDAFIDAILEVADASKSGATDSAGCGNPVI
jgi:pimeloyl-ACP methyl ester carboxylesterase